MYLQNYWWFTRYPIKHIVGNLCKLINAFSFLPGGTRTSENVRQSIVSRSFLKNIGLFIVFVFLVNPDAGGKFRIWGIKGWHHTFVLNRGYVTFVYYIRMISTFSIWLGSLHVHERTFSRRTWGRKAYERPSRHHKLPS